MTSIIRNEADLAVALRALRGVRDDRVAFRLADSLRAAFPVIAAAEKFADVIRPQHKPSRTTMLLVERVKAYRGACGR